MLTTLRVGPAQTDAAAAANEEAYFTTVRAGLDAIAEATGALAIQLGRTACGPTVLYQWRLADWQRRFPVIAAWCQYSDDITSADLWATTEAGGVIEFQFEAFDERSLATLLGLEPPEAVLGLRGLEAERLALWRELVERSATDAPSD